MTLRIVLTDGNNIQGLVGTFGAFIQTNIIQTATDAAAAAASAAAAAASAALAASDESSAASSASAAANSASAAASSATSALNSASAANSSATAAAASATNSASSATAAAGSATNAANSATAASGSATTANTSATNAAASATAAANSATAAAGSATSAANTAAQLNSEYSFSTTGGTTTLTSGQAASGIIVVNGALTSNATIVVPATPHNFSVRNNTTGNYSVTFQASGQAPTASVVQGKSTAFYSDASGVYAASASAGVAFGAINPYAGNVSLTIAHLGNVIEQSTNGAITTLPLAATFPAGSGVAIKDRSSTGVKIATQGSDTCELAVPYSTTPQDVFYLYSDGVSVWKVGFYANAETPTFSGTVNAKGGITFADGTLQTTANSTTQPASTWYTVGSTDTVGSFADGDTAIRTSGFTAPFVDVIKNGLVLTRGQHYTLNADNVHINFTDPLINNGVDSDQLEVKTKGVYNPSSTYLPSLPWVTPAAGATFIAYPHVVGFAWLLVRGAFLQAGTDYTEDATGFYLVGFAADGVEQYGVFNMNAVSIANALAAANPIISSGPLTFADGSIQNTAALSERNLFIDGAFDQWGGAGTLGTTLAYLNATMWPATCGVGGAGSISAVDIRSVAGTSTTYAAFESSPKNVFVFSQTTPSTGTPAAYTAPQVSQRVEGVATAAGRSLTFSVKLWVASGTLNITSIQCRQSFGTGSSPSSPVTADKTVNWNITTTPKKFSVRLDVPRIDGMTIGTNGGDYLIVGLWLPAGVTFTLGIAEAQLERSSANSSSDINGAGGSPTPFEYRGYGPELARVQRYYENGSEPDFYQATGNSAISAAYGEVRFAVTKRSSPAISFSGWLYYSAGVNTSFTPGIHSSPTDKFSFTGTSLTNWNGWYPGGSWTADARI